MKIVTVSLSMLAASSLLFGLWNAIDARNEVRELRSAMKQLNATRADPGDKAGVPPLSAIEELRLRARVAAGSLAESAPAAPDPAPARWSRKSSEAAPTTLEQIQEHTLEAYDTEGTDSGWSNEAAQALATSMRTALAQGSRLLSIECRTTMCKVEVEHADEHGARALLESGFREWHGSVLNGGERESHGAIVQTLIPVREGAAPPWQTL